MRSTVIATLVAASACGIACDDAVLGRPPAPTPKDHSNPFGWPLGPDCVDCQRDMVGTPSWEPARVVLFSGNVGAAGASLAPLAQAIVQPLHKGDPNAPVFESSVAHPPPYDDEIYDLLDARGITASQVFTDAQFAGPQAVIMAVTLVPSAGGAEGESADFPSGPVIPDIAFPIEISWALYRDGAVVDEGGSFDVCPSNAPSQSACVAHNVSHLFAAIADNAALAGDALAPPDGDYDYAVLISDSNGNGWSLWVPFKVGEPPPSGGGPPDSGSPDVGPPNPARVVPDLTPMAVDASGTVIVGLAWGEPQRAARWSADTGLTRLPMARATDDQSRAAAISGDGKVIAGWSSTPGSFTHWMAVRWPDPSTVEMLGFARPDDDVSMAIAISDDGSTIMGTSGNALSNIYAQTAFRWKGGAMTAIDPLPGDDGTEPRCMSDDGSTIAGLSWKSAIGPSSPRAFVWNVDTGMEEVALPDGAQQLDVRSLSADGSVMVGDAFFGPSGTPSQAFRWTRATGAVLLTPAGHYGRVGGVSADGAVVAGSLDGGAFFWTSAGLEWIAVPSSSSIPMGLDTTIFDPRGQTLAGQVEHDLLLFRRNPGGLTVTGPVSGVYSWRLIAITGDGRTLLLDGSSAGQDRGGAVLLPLR